MVNRAKALAQSDFKSIVVRQYEGREAIKRISKY
jgi:hypothetical protein